MKIKLLLAATVLASATGCVSLNVSPPVDMAQVPNDCYNRQMIIGWLQDQAAMPRKNGESLEAYENYRRQIRAKIWHLRYSCQPV